PHLFGVAALRFSQEPLICREDEDPGRALVTHEARHLLANRPSLVGLVNGDRVADLKSVQRLFELLERDAVLAVRDEHLLGLAAGRRGHWRRRRYDERLGLGAGAVLTAPVRPGILFGALPRVEGGGRSGEVYPQ